MAVSPLIRACFPYNPAMPDPDIFDAAFLRQLEALDEALLRLRGQAGEGIARHGRAIGSSEFRGHRPYAHGDDLRRLDWNAYGRLGKFFMREYERERAEHVTLLVDVSRSMAPGRKHVLARRAAAAMAYLALRRGGSAAVVGQPAVEGIARFGKLLDQLRALEPQGGALEPQLQALAARPRTPSDLFVVTDGLEPVESLQPLAALSERRASVTLLLVLAPDEMHPPAAGSVELRSLEEDQRLQVQLGDTLVAAYRAELERHLEAIELLARRNGWNLAVADSAADLRELFMAKLAGGLP